MAMAPNRQIGGELAFPVNNLLALGTANIAVGVNQSGLAHSGEFESVVRPRENPMNSLFGVELPPSVTFVVAFVIVLGLIGATFWLVRRFGAARLAAGRGRQPRLAVIDAAAVDGRRKLIIIRRDNVEHLLMIGGPSDVVIETNILRAGAAIQRDTTASRPSVDSLPRAVTLPETTTWPLQPEPIAAPRVDRPRMLADEIALMPPPIPPPSRALSEPPTRSQPAIDPLMGLAAELSRSKPEVGPRPVEPPRIPLTPQYPIGETPVVPTAPTISTAQIAPAASATPPADAHLAEMAHRLETALRRPIASGAPSAKPEAAQRPTATIDQKRAESRPSAATNGPTHGTTNGSPGNGAQGKSLYENLEQEMASLLGRQSGKT
jgi:flagellar protein FliO/FliZ